MHACSGGNTPVEGLRAEAQSGGAAAQALWREAVGSVATHRKGSSAVVQMPTEGAVIVVPWLCLWQPTWQLPRCTGRECVPSMTALSVLEAIKYHSEH
jgi:hypothetical protein